VPFLVVCSVGSMALDLERVNNFSYVTDAEVTDGIWICDTDCDTALFEATLSAHHRLWRL
jgi:uncharacterized protein YegJ (DUF2314 family)